MITVKYLALELFMLTGPILPPVPALAHAGTYGKDLDLIEDNRLALKPANLRTSVASQLKVHRDTAAQFALAQVVSAKQPSNDAGPVFITRPSDAGTLIISAELSTELGKIILDEKVQAERATFDLVVGALVPTTVKLHPLPPNAAELIPTHRSYQFFVVTDQRIIIVDPSTLEIIYVLVV